MRRRMTILCSLLVALTALGLPGSVDARPPLVKKSVSQDATRLVTIKLRFETCVECSVTLVQATSTVFWHSHTKPLRGDSDVAFRVPVRRTRGMSIEVRAPWETGADSVANVVTRYKGHPVGALVSRKAAARAKKATACWAGTTAQQVTLRVRVDSFTASDHGTPGPALRVWLKRGHRTGGAPWQTTERGRLGNQDAYYCR